MGNDDLPLWIDYLERKLLDLGFESAIEPNGKSGHPVMWLSNIGLQLWDSVVTRLVVRVLHPVQLDVYLRMWNESVRLAITDYLGIGYQLYDVDFKLPSGTEMLEHSCYKTKRLLETANYLITQDFPDVIKSFQLKLDYVDVV